MDSRALFIQEFLLKFYNSNFPVDRLIEDAKKAWDAISNKEAQ